MQKRVPQTLLKPASDNLHCLYVVQLGQVHNEERRLQGEVMQLRKDNQLMAEALVKNKVSGSCHAIVGLALHQRYQDNSLCCNQSVFLCRAFCSS